MILPLKKMIWVFVIAAVLCCTATSAFGLSYNTLYVADRNTNLYTVDSTTGVADLVVPLGVSEITDIAFSGTDLFLITDTRLYNIDLVTGVGTPVLDLERSLYMNSLAADDSGMLYAAGADGDLFSIDPDPSAPEMKKIGNLGIAGGGASGDLEFVNGTLYASVYFGSDSDPDYLATINLETGQATPYTASLAYPLVFGLGYKDGTLFGQTVSGYPETLAGQLIEINTETGVGTEIGSIIERSTNRPVNPWGMSVSPMAPAPVPEPAAILLLCSGLGALGFLRFGRRLKK